MGKGWENMGGSFTVRDAAQPGNLLTEPVTWCLRTSFSGRQSCSLEAGVWLGRVRGGGRQPAQDQGSGGWSGDLTGGETREDEEPDLVGLCSGWRVWGGFVTSPDLF